MLVFKGLLMEGATTQPFQTIEAESHEKVSAFILHYMYSY